MSRKALEHFLDGVWESLPRLRQTIETAFRAPNGGAALDKAIGLTHAIGYGASAQKLEALSEVASAQELLLARVQFGSLKFDRGVFHTLEQLTDLMEAATSSALTNPVADESMFDDLRRLVGRHLPPSSVSADPKVARTSFRAEMPPPAPPSEWVLFRNAANEQMREMARRLDLFRRDRNRWDVLADVRRRLHSLRTAARSAGLSDFAGLSQHTEDVIQRLLDRSVPANDRAADCLLATVDGLEARLHGALDPESMLQLHERLDEVAGERSRYAAELQDSFAVTRELVEPPAPREVLKPVQPVGIELDDRSMLTGEMLEVFSEEADEHLDRIDAALKMLEVNPARLSSIHDIRRSAHTLKGAAGAVQLRLVSKVAHRMEDLLDRVAESLRPVLPPTISLLHSTSDTLHDLVGGRFDPESMRTTVTQLFDRYDAAIASDSLREVAAPTVFDGTMQPLDNPLERSAVATSIELPPTVAIVEPPREVRLVETPEIVEPVTEEPAPIILQLPKPSDLETVTEHAGIDSTAGFEVVFPPATPDQAESTRRDFSKADLSQVFEVSNLPPIPAPTVGEITIAADAPTTPMTPWPQSENERSNRSSDAYVQTTQPDVGVRLTERLATSAKVPTEVERSVTWDVTAEWPSGAASIPEPTILRVPDVAQSLTAMKSAATLEPIVALEPGIALEPSIADDRATQPQPDDFGYGVFEPVTPLPETALAMPSAMDVAPALAATAIVSDESSGITELPAVPAIAPVNEIIVRDALPMLATWSQRPLNEKLIDSSFSETAESEKRQGETLRVPLERVDSLVREVGELLINRSSFEQRMSDFLQCVDDMQRAVERLRQASRDLDTKYGVGALGGRRRTWNEAGGPRGVASDFSAKAQEEFDALEMDRYTEFHLLSRTLSEATTDIGTIGLELRNVHADFDQLLNRQGRIGKNTQDRLMQIRMVPLMHMAGRLERTVRSVAETEGKQVDFVIAGGETEVDKRVLEELADPLMHLLRNAVDHGIETPDKRLASNKPDRATIRLEAFAQGTQVVLKISDDGVGLNLEAIRRTGLRLGLIGSEDADRISHEQLAAMIFLPGLSTADSVSEISGRGIGMDIVADKVRKLKGTISVESREGHGTAFTIRLPITLSVTRALLVIAGSETFALPLPSVVQILRVERDAVERLGNAPVLRLGGEALPLAYLADRLKLRQPADQTTAMLPVVVIANGDDKLAVVVDKILAGRDIVVKPLGSHLQQVPGLLGATLLGDGSVVPILDPAKLVTATAAEPRVRPKPATTSPAEPDVSRIADAVKRWESRSAESRRLHELPRSEGTTAPDSADRRFFAETPEFQAATSDEGALPTEVASEQEPEPPVIMVVDDSVSVRRVTANLLKKAGFVPLEAKDGLDALDKLRTARKAPELFLLDIEMPRMDGFELLNSLRMSAAYRATPVVMITSRAAEKHRTKARQLGANEYLVKPFQDEQLLTLIGSLLANSESLAKS